MSSSLTHARTHAHCSYRDDPCMASAPRTNCSHSVTQKSYFLSPGGGGGVGPFAPIAIYAVRGVFFPFFPRPCPETTMRYASSLVLSACLTIAYPRDPCRRWRRRRSPSEILESFPDGRVDIASEGCAHVSGYIYTCVLECVYC